MATKLVQTPVSDELLLLLLEKLAGKTLTYGMTGVKKGVNPSEIIFVTQKGEIPCRVGEIPMFIVITLPSGKRLGVPRRQIETK